MNKVLTIAIAMFCMLLHVDLAAQDGPAPSQTQTLSQKVGMTDVSIVYSRPSMKERTIYAADGLVPFGKTWRTGANAATKLTFGDEVTLGGEELKAGDYALLTVPGESEWEVMVYPYESGNWNSYKDKEAAASFKVEPFKMEGVSVETFLIEIGNVTDNSANIGLIWESTYVPIPLGVK